MAFHPAFARLQNAKALILVDSARHDRRLLADYAFADDFGIHAFSHGVVNEPAAGEELCRQFADVLDAHEVSENVVRLRGLGVIAQIDGADGDSYSVCLTVKKTSPGHSLQFNERGAG